LAVYEAVKSSPKASEYPNVARWFKHISSYTEAERAAFPGEKKDVATYGIGNAKVAEPEKKEDEDDIDLFGSDDEVDEEAEKLKEQRLAEYRAKKAAKPKTIAKSSVVLDVKPWDDETDMKALEEGVRKISMEGLLWGASKLVAVGYGIKKLQIGAVVEDDKVSTDELIEEHIMALEDYVQSVDIAAFQKI
jgi:elongation factor 1-beta